MSNKVLDCTGLQCPMPVIMTKKELEEKTVSAVEVTVDNLTAKENLVKLGKSMNISTEVIEKEGKYTVLLVKNGETVSTPQKESPAEESPVSYSKGESLLITSEFLGKGDDELGKILMKGFIYTISETEPFPKRILLLNSAVKLTTLNEEAVTNLKKLEDKGVEILSCGTCLDFYSVKDQLKVGRVANMYDIVEALKTTTDKFIV